MYGDTCGVENHTSNNVCDTLVTKHVILLYCTVSCMLGFFLGCCAIQSECESSAYWNPLAAWRVIKMAESNPFFFFGAPDAVSGLKYTSAALVPAGGGWLALGGEALTGKKLRRMRVREPEPLNIRYLGSHSRTSWAGGHSSSGPPQDCAGTTTNHTQEEQRATTVQEPHEESRRVPPWTDPAVDRPAYGPHRPTSHVEKCNNLMVLD